MVSDVEKVRLELQWWLVIQAGVLFVNAMFRDGKMRWEVDRDKVVIGCGLIGMFLDDNKIRSRDEITWPRHDIFPLKNIDKNKEHLSINCQFYYYWLI